MLCEILSLSTVNYNIIYWRYDDSKKYWDPMESILPTV